MATNPYYTSHFTIRMLQILAQNRAEAPRAPWRTLVACTAWSGAEGSDARFNPFDTTWVAAGSDDFNPTGVQNYPDLKTGIQATVDTLNLSYYTKVIEELLTGTSMEGICAAVGDSPWGTDGALMLALCHSYPVLGEELHLGTANADVSILQRQLNEHHATITGLHVDGEYGVKTEAAVRRYQAKVGLRVDRVCGQQTWAALHDGIS